ncbi:MAG TPA: NAD(P)-binding domain-containing protein, partial [Bradyrhizobium sp.]
MRRLVRAQAGALARPLQPPCPVLGTCPARQSGYGSRKAMAPNNAPKIGWIGMGRMGFPMAERLIKAGHDVSIWNRTKAKA